MVREATTSMARVLVIDDDAAFVENVRAAVSSCVDLRVVADEAGAVAAVRAWEPDLVVLDLLLDGADGFALLEWLTGPGVRRAPAVLCATGGHGAHRRSMPRGGWPVGTLLRDGDTRDLREAILEVVEGQGPPLVRAS